MSLCLHFVLWISDKSVITEIFFDFCYLSRTTGVPLLLLLKKVLRLEVLTLPKPEVRRMMAH